MLPVAGGNKPVIKQISILIKVLKPETGAVGTEALTVCPRY